MTPTCTSTPTTRTPTTEPATTADADALRVAVVWRGDEAARHTGIASNERLRPVVDALVALGVSAIPTVYRDKFAAEVHADLLELDGVLVWIDPIGHGEDRTRFDEILHDLSSAGVWVSAHPDTIALIGTKDVLYRTRSLGWGSDVHRYTTLAQLQSELPGRLADGPRVVKRPAATPASECGRSRSPASALDRSRRRRPSSCMGPSTATPTSTRWCWPRSLTSARRTSRPAESSSTNRSNHE